MHAVAPCPCFFVQVSRFQLLERGRWCEGEIERERERERGRTLGWVVVPIANKNEDDKVESTPKTSLTRLCEREREKKIVFWNKEKKII
jgi:hypothetical protein